VRPATDNCDLDDTIDLRALAARLWSSTLVDHRRVILFTAAFGVVAFVMTPIYRTAMVLSRRVSGVRK